MEEATQDSFYEFSKYLELEMSFIQENMFLLVEASNLFIIFIKQRFFDIRIDIVIFDFVIFIRQIQS